MSQKRESKVEVFRVNIKKTILIHPFLFTLISIQFLYQGASVTISFTQVFRALFLLWMLLVLLSFPAYKILKDWDWVGISLSLFAFGFFYEQHIFIVVVSILAIILLLLFFYIKIRKRKTRIEEITLFLNVLSFVFVLVVGINFISLLGNIPNSYYQNILLRSADEVIAQASPYSEKPDIYYIVLDAYSNSEILTELYGYDNSSFLSHLHEKGFIIPSTARSNYPKTALSVPATLNMNYVQRIAPELEESYFWWLMTPLISNSQTRIMLEDIGYQSVAIASDWSITNNRTTDYYYSPSSLQVSDFENYILQNTALIVIKPLLEKIAFVPSNASHRSLILYNFESLSHIPDLQGPHFVFSHIISPHPPFVFDKNGNMADPGYSLTFSDANDYPGSQEEYRQGYIEQVDFINKQTMRIIDEILEKSTTPPIIILQADHGSGMLTDFNSLENTCLKERFSPFSAYYLPNLDKDLIPEDITPVNIFRIVFNEYFETDLPLLENRFYFPKDAVHIYDMDEISLQDINNTPCDISLE